MLVWRVPALRRFMVSDEARLHETRDVAALHLVVLGLMSVALILDRLGAFGR